MLIVLSLLILANCWQLAFNGFDKRKLKATNGVLVRMPVYHEYKRSHEWEFRLKGDTIKYILGGMNLCGIGKQTIYKMQPNDSITIFTYSGHPIIRLLEHLEGETIIYGVFWKDETYLNIDRIRQQIAHLNVFIVALVLFFSGLWLGAWYWEDRKAGQN